ncbi:MAG: hypothetical protein SFW62_00480 [Alphaproteobacteria bacterium]|nr:hypothetical protein [Alphaproteobacteria bacterium]
MKFGKQPHILSASTDLIGICFILITGMKLTNASVATIADEICFFAAVVLIGSCILSYISIRAEKNAERLEKIADYLFLTGLFSLFIAVTAIAYDFF